MNKAEVIAGPSCLTAAADDEPLFVLRANDEHAPAIIREWAERYIRSKTPPGRPANPTTREYAKFREALHVADAMDRWRVRPRA